MTVLNHQRVATVYLVRLDKKTTDLLKGHRVKVNAMVEVSEVDVNGLHYAVPWHLDNEYVHKAIRKNLREAINDAKMNVIA